MAKSKPRHSQTCTVVIKGKQVTFQSRHDDRSALGLLRFYLLKGRIRSPFARELAEKSPLSRLQLDWVHRLVQQAEHRVRSFLPPASGPRIVGSGQSRKPGSHRSNW